MHCTTPLHYRLSCCTSAVCRSFSCMKIILLCSVQPTWGSLPREVPEPKEDSSLRLYVHSCKIWRPMSMSSFGKYPKSCGGNVGKSIMNLHRHGWVLLQGLPVHLFPPVVFIGFLYPLLLGSKKMLKQWVCLCFKLCNCYH